jgi:amino acid transporter
MGLLGLVATGVCSMIGAGVNVIPFMIQRHAPGIGPHVLPAFVFAALPAALAGLAYAVLASAMPRAGGSYVYASRALDPYLGFVASFSQWFSLCVAIGVVSYLIVPFLRDVAAAAGAAAFAAALRAHEGRAVPAVAAAPLTPSILLPASALLFASFIGFDSIAQAGGESRNPGRNLPLAIGIAVLSVGIFYMLFTGAVYHAVPWQFIAAEARRRDVTAPGLLGMLLPPAWTAVILSGAAVALIKDLPAMLLGVSRLMFAWAEDGIFPRGIAAVHPRFRTPHAAILASAGMATLGILGCHVAGDFFLGIDVLVTSMLVNFLLMAVSVLTLPGRNAALAREVTVIPSRALQVPLAATAVVVLALFLGVHTWRDVTAPAAAWYFRSTPLWILVMAAGSIVYLRETRRLRREGVDLDARFAALPPG